MGKTVGIRDLKTHLSGYVRDVKKGEEILVSERGKVVARLVPAEQRSEVARLRQLLLRLSAEDRIILPKIYKKAARPAGRKKVKGSPFSEAVLEGRR